jgi:hypothetical protein
MSAYTHNDDYDILMNAAHLEVVMLGQYLLHDGDQARLQALVRAIDTDVREYVT